MKQSQREEVGAFIRQHPTYSARQIAAHFGYSYYHFSRNFKKHMGVSLRDYIAAVKVELSMQSLAQGSNVTQSQLDAHYESAGTFSNTFKSFTLFSPKAHIRSLISISKTARQQIISAEERHLTYANFAAQQHQQTHSLRVQINNRSSANSWLFLAFFSQALPKGTPVLGICLRTQSEVEIKAIPNGRYYVMVCEIAQIKQLFLGKKLLPSLDNCQRDLCHTPIDFPLSNPQSVTLNLRAARLGDPPINIHPIKLLVDGLRKNTQSAN